MPKGNHRYEGALPKRIEHPLTALGVETLSRRMGVEYKGTSEALVAAGLALPEWLPGRPECPHTRIFRIIVDGRYAIFINLPVAGGYRAVFHETLKEKAAREAQERRERDEQANQAKPMPQPLTGQRKQTEGGWWPPDVRNNRNIRRGNGSRWHFCGSPEAMASSGLLEPDEIPGHPACARKGYVYGWYDDQLFAAVRLGPNIALTLLEKNTNIIACRPRRLEKGAQT